jgi:hypothetical protein
MTVDQSRGFDRGVPSDTDVRGLTAIVLVVLAQLMLPVVSTHADSSTGWSPGPGATLDNTYTGSIDAPTLNAVVPTGSFSVSGWFVDTTAQGWPGADDIQIWLGTMDGGGQFLSETNLGLTRPDVVAALSNPNADVSGFYGMLPPNSLPIGPQTLSVYAHTPDKGWWFRQVQVTASTNPPPVATATPIVSGGAPPIVAFETPKVSEVVLTNANALITGYALDKNAGAYNGVAGIDRVQVYIGGDRDSGGLYLGDALLGNFSVTAFGLYGAQFGSSGWRLSFQPTHFQANGYVLFAYARSALTGKEAVATRYIAIHEP